VLDSSGLTISSSKFLVNIINIHLLSVDLIISIVSNILLGNPPNETLSFSDLAITSSFEIDLKKYLECWCVPEKDMATEFLMTSSGGLSLCGDEEFAWLFVSPSSGIGKWGAIAHEKCKVVHCRVKKSKIWP
jgi:hypothetical protein